LHLSENVNDKKRIWLYAVILFMSAFIILLLTAYSQIKFKNNTSEYENQLSAQEVAKKSVITNLNQVIKENKKLKDEYKAVNEQLIKARSDNETNRNKVNELQKKYIDSIVIYETIVKAYDEYNKGNTVNCALLLNANMDFGKLNTDAYKIYKFLVDMTFKKAANILYIKGKNEYINKNYLNAVNKFKQSLSLSPNDYFSDGCYYYIAYAEYRQGHKNEVKKALKQLTDNFPRSTYIEDANDLLNQIR
jgi:TolA-binding protein